MAGKAEYRPNPSPQWVRETLCEDLAELSRNQGQLPSTRAIERVVDGDISTFQALERVAKPKPRVDRSREVEGEAPLNKSDPAADLARRQGAELIRGGEARPQPKRVKCTCGGTCKRCKLFARIRALYQLNPDYLRHVRMKVASGPRPEGKPVAKGLEPSKFLFPRFAKEIAAAQRESTLQLGPYKGKPFAERDRILLRRLEDIADRSTGLLGGWWV